MLGPFTVTSWISPYAYHLELPAPICIQQVQSILLLAPVTDNSLVGQCVIPVPPVEVDSEEEYQVTSFEDSRIYRN